MGGTCYSMGLMLAYNQFSGNSALLNYNTSTLPAVNANDAGGGGRVARRRSSSSRPTAPPTHPRRPISSTAERTTPITRSATTRASPSTSEYPTNVNGYNDNDPTLVSGIISLVNQLAAPSTAQGYSTPSKPLLLHCIAFGPQITADGLSTLNQMQTAGNVTDGPPNTLPSYKIINGNASTYASNLQQAFATILQDGVQVSLIQ